VSGLREAVREVGQRLMVGFDGHTASADARRLIRDFGVGGIILFKRNVDSPEQVADLVRELQSLARAAGQEKPLLVAVDQEGGRVARLSAPWAVWPPLRALGRTGSEEMARQMGEALSAELAACGIRLDLAPVLDVDTNPANPVIGDRSFGDDPELVGRLGAAMIRGLQAGGVAACAKHFPGHGDTSVDSHLDLPVLEHGRTRVDDVELRPFRQAVAADVASVMTAHVLFPALDADLPATLSPKVVDGVLRGEMGYDGVVFSDDLEMKAVAARWPPARSAVLAARAGCDVVLVCKEVEAQVASAEGLIRAVEDGALPWAGMDDALRRVRRLKERFVSPHGDPDPRQARLAAGGGRAQVLALEIAERGGVPA
jgi:beta-N-acetylhexosaminidase